MEPNGIAGLFFPLLLVRYHSSFFQLVGGANPSGYPMGSSEVIIECPLLNNFIQHISAPE
jgi:hypothetical protein